MLLFGAVLERPRLPLSPPLVRMEIQIGRELRGLGLANGCRVCVICLYV